MIMSWLVVPVDWEKREKNKEGRMDFKIFVSHHETETEIAQGIRRFLESMSKAIAVETFVDKANRDSDFRNWISNAIKGSKLFIFLYADDARDLSWAAHELGIYEGMGNGERGHVVCLRSRDIKDMPSVMSHIAPVDATEVGIANCLEDILARGVYSDGQRLANDTFDLADLSARIKTEAKQLACLFRSKIHTQYFTDRLIIRNIDAIPRAEFDGEINDAFQVVRSVSNREGQGEIEYVLDFSQAKIETNERIMGMLRLPLDYKWSDLVRLHDRLEDSDNAVDRFHVPSELLKHASSEHNQFATEMMLSNIEIDGNIVVPIISRVEIRDRLPISYFLLLIPDPASRHEEIGIHDELANGFARDVKIVLMLAMARRFRWNVVEPYVWKIRRAIGSDIELKGVLREFMAGLCEIEEESARCKFDDGHLAVLHFPEQHRDNLSSLWVSYGQIRDELDAAVEAADARKALEILNQFQQINRVFMATALDVYKDMITGLPTLDEYSKNWRVDFFRDAAEREETGVRLAPGTLPVAE